MPAKEIKVSDDTILAAITTLRANMEDRFADIDGKVTSLRVAVFERFDRVETRLTEIRDDITVNMGRSDRLEGMVHSDRAALQGLATEMSTLTRKVRQLESKVHDLTRPG